MGCLKQYFSFCRGKKKAEKADEKWVYRFTQYKQYYFSGEFFLPSSVVYLIFHGIFVCILYCKQNFIHLKKHFSLAISLMLCLLL